MQAVVPIESEIKAKDSGVNVKSLEKDDKHEDSPSVTEPQGKDTKPENHKSLGKIHKNQTLKLRTQVNKVRTCAKTCPTLM